MSRSRPGTSFFGLFSGSARSERSGTTFAAELLAAPSAEELGTRAQDGYTIEIAPVLWFPGPRHD
jgi:hypothetical protein